MRALWFYSLERVGCSSEGEEGGGKHINSREREGRLAGCWSTVFSVYFS